MRHTMNVMDQTGHSSVTWDPGIPDEVAMARQSYDAMIAKGYTAFAVNEDDQRGSRMSKFDPQAGKVMMVPQLRGG